MNAARRALAFLLCAGAVLYAAGARADALRQVEHISYDDHHDAPAQSSDSARTNESDESDESDESGEDEDDSELGLGGLMGRAVFYVLSLPWQAPYALLDDPCLDGYAHHPYEDGPGLLRTRACAPEQAQRAHQLAFDAGLESGFMLERVLATTANMRLQLPARAELDTRISLLRDLAEQPAENALTMASHLAFRFARSRNVDFRTGLGLRLYHFEVTQLGVDFLYAIDAYLGRGLIARVELHCGNLGRALTAQARTTLGLMIERFELYAGYDHTVFWADAGDASLGGPIAGLRTWF